MGIYSQITPPISSSPSVPIQFTTDSGIAIPALNNLNVFGTGASSTSGSGSTITITSSANPLVAVTSPGAYPYTTLATDDVILVDTSSARTIIPMAAPATGRVYIIKDSVGSAASNNITVTPSGKNIDGAASSVININYGSITIIYNGSEWSVA